MISMADYYDPKRPTGVNTVMLREGINMECYWPSSNSEPRFYIKPVRGSSTTFSIMELSEIARMCDQIVAEHKNQTG